MTPVMTTPVHSAVNVPLPVRIEHFHNARSTAAAHAVPQLTVGLQARQPIVPRPQLTEGQLAATPAVPQLSAWRKSYALTSSELMNGTLTTWRDNEVRNIHP